MLSGNVCGSVQMDWERVRREACALFTPGANAREAADAPDAANGEGEAVLWEDAPAAEATEGEADKSASAWENAPAVEAPAAVSYTHLDVYKRQSIYFMRRSLL